MSEMPSPKPRIHPRFSFVPIRAPFVQKADQISLHCTRLLEVIESEVPEGRGRSLAITKLEESWQWSMYALAELAQKG